MTIPPVLPIALELFLEEWRAALMHNVSDDEARDFVLLVKQRMTEIALRREDDPL